MSKESLTDVVCKSAKATDKAVKLFDGGGLFLHVTPQGGKTWRLKYRFGGIEKLLSLGTYPEVPLKAARKKRDAAREQLAAGIDPGAAKKAEKLAKSAGAANSFEAVAREWFATHEKSWAPSHSSKIIRRLEVDVFPWLGARPIAEITAPELLAVLKRTVARGTLETAHRAKQNCGQVFRYAVQTGRALRDPSADLKGALPAYEPKNFAAFTEPADLAALLRATDAFKGTFVVQCALRLAPMLFVRPGELRKAKWAEFELEQGYWAFKVSKVKTPHIVPLAKQAVAVLRELHALTGGGEYVFTGRDPKKPMSDAAVNAALRRMGYDTKTEITGHGFRATARTILHERLGQKPESIEHQLSHRVPDNLGTAYNRTKFIDDRIRMIQIWADYLDTLRAGGNVVAGKFGRVA